MVPHSILVTGANGLIGFDLVRRLNSDGRRVVAVDRSISEVCAVTDEAFELEIGDAHRLHEIAARFDIDAIAHCGGVSGPMLGRDNPAMLFRVNVGGTVDVAEVARQMAARRGSCRLVFCSSLTVYGDQPQDGIAGVYGPRRRTSCVLRLMIDNALSGRPTRLPYGQGFPRQWVHVDDVVAGIVRALDVGDPKRRVFNVSGGVNPTIDEAADLVRRLIPGADIELQAGPDPEDITLGLLSIEAARADLGYAPQVSLRAGIERLVATCRHASSA